MIVLVIGSGGREHALVWKIIQSPLVKKIYCAPGNGGISKHAECIDIEANDIKGLVRFAKKNKVDLTIVGPELPLTLGIVDSFQKAKLTVFGSNKKAAEIEGSKRFTKDLMAKYNIPSANYRVFRKYREAVKHIHEKEPPLVLKADGLAAGKGVLVCRSRNEAFEGAERILKKKEFGSAGDCLIVEDCLIGEEASILAITDGEKLVTLPSAQDHKAIFEGDTGPNTGGMGAYAPAPVVTPKMLDVVKEKILYPTIRGMKQEGRPYQGVLYAGLMFTSEGPKVLEYNCRFGDPEIQAILPLLETDLIALIMACLEGRLKDNLVKVKNSASVCVVMASGGYPGSYEKGKVIHGLDNLQDDIVVFHAGTKKKNGEFVTSGGRVLGVTAMDNTIGSAITKVYEAVGKITFDMAYYRRDIGHRALKRI